MTPSAEIPHQAGPLPGRFQFLRVLQLEPKWGSIGSQLQCSEPHEGIEDNRPILGSHPFQVASPIAVLLSGHALHQGAYPLVRQE
ncbi:MAG: hypothetical protein ACK559_37620, partial [bacterium]